MIKQIESALKDLKQLKPLVLCLTNYVTMDFMANSLLALGAAPVMSVSECELEELIKISNIVNINIGTLDDAFIARCQFAVKCAKQYHKPLILDPVGAGASLMRTKIARELLVSADIIKGNASEIMALMDDTAQTHGVDSSNPTEQARDYAYTLANKFNSTVVVSGAKDFITDGSREEFLTFGSDLMPLITGMGCTLTAVIAAFRAVVSNPFEAAKIATSYFGLCGNLAHLKTKKPGSFRTSFIDELYAANFKEMEQFYV